jgi:hypothetical protein
MFLVKENNNIGVVWIEPTYRKTRLNTQDFERGKGVQSVPTGKSLL